jgi:hypothetical protein
MKSDIMNKTNLIVGKYYLERPDIIIDLSKNNLLFTTDIAYSEQKYPELSDLNILEFSETEILQYITFLSEHPYLQRIGFYEASILFVAVHRKMKVATNDAITRQVCHNLGIETIDIDISTFVLKHNKDEGVPQYKKGGKYEIAS